MNPLEFHLYTVARWNKIRKIKDSQDVLVSISVGKYRGLGKDELYNDWRQGVRSQISKRREELMIPEGITPNQKDRGIRGAILVNKQYDPDYSISLGLSEGGHQGGREAI